MTLLQKLQSLLSAANARTAANDATLTDAVQSLISGFGTIPHVYTTDFTPAVDTDVFIIPIVGFTHAPSLVLVYTTDEIEPVTEQCVYQMILSASLYPTGSITSTINPYTGKLHTVKPDRTKSSSSVGSYCTATASAFTFNRSQTSYSWYGGVTYHFIFLEGVESPCS